MTVHYRKSEEPARAVSTLLYSTVSKTDSARRGLYRNAGKRALDITVCLLSAPFVLTIVGILALIVARDGGKPFYTQSRVGQNGRIYRMWKLRSMVPNADQKLEAYLASNPEAREEWDRDQKLKNDPRITSFGHFLRRASLDELPQLWNVLRGDMSLVGPRPMMTSQRELYPGRDYYDLRPGITGSWQVSKRNESTFADRAAFDSSYNKKLSFREDLRILVATVRVVLNATGY